MQEVGGSIPPGSTSFHIGNRWIFLRPASPSSRGLGHIPFTDATGVRIPVGTPILNAGLVGASGATAYIHPVIAGGALPAVFDQTHIYGS